MLVTGATGYLAIGFFTFWTPLPVYWALAVYLMRPVFFADFLGGVGTFDVLFPALAIQMILLTISYLIIKHTCDFQKFITLNVRFPAVNEKKQKVSPPNDFPGTQTEFL